MVKEVIISIMVFVSFFSLNAQPRQKIVIDTDIQLISLGDSIFMHETWHTLDEYGRFPSNGLIVIRNARALMIDTPYDNEKTERLTSYLKDSMSVEMNKLIVGHFHNDCLGGLGYLQAVGVESIANLMTIEKCKELGLPVPDIAFTDSMIFDFYGETIDCRYFGGGHSFDNITVWIPASKVLFGGCLVKSIDSKNLGNLSDAVVPDWDSTVKKLMKRYADVKIVVPGHGGFGGAELLNHTINLVESYKHKNLK